MSMPETWSIELTKFLAMNSMEKITWLSHLMFFLSMFARETYCADSGGVENPLALRSYNELLHRIASHQLKIAKNDSEGMPDDQFFEMLAMMVNEVGLREDTLLERLQFKSASN